MRERAVGDGIDGFSDWLAVGVDGLQMGAEEFTGVGVNVLDLQPLGFDRFDGLAVVTGGSSPFWSLSWWSASS